MKLSHFPLGLLALVSSALHAKPTPPLLDYLRLIRCVKEIENAAITYVSPSGARGVYQIKQRTWEHYSTKPHEWASTFDRICQIENQRVALAFAHDIVEKYIPALGLPVTPYSFCLLYGPGYDRISKMNLTDANVDFAQRFAALYQDPTW